jgi:O-acetyl-ADP-ribose deacetylase (regulator of RNase III)
MKLVRQIVAGHFPHGHACRVYVSHLCIVKYVCHVITGVGGALKDRVARAAYYAVIEFDSKMQTSTQHHLKTIRFVNNDEAATTAFVETFTQCRNARSKTSIDSKPTVAPEY